MRSDPIPRDHPSAVPFIDPEAAAPPSTGAGVSELAHGATAWRLDGDRLFLQHGPINLVVHAAGAASAVEESYRALTDAFPNWLGALVDELPRLRRVENERLELPRGPIARRMAAAVRTCRAGFVTPMAAVAGAVADEAARVLASQSGVERAYVNNGGDIALHLGEGTRLSVGVVPSLREAIPRAHIDIPFDSTVRGVATSGWQGRSHSLGIADAVTVLAPSAAVADAAATLIANAVDVDHPDIRREPARALDEDSDLGDRLVTVAVPPLGPEAIGAALDAGVRAARALRARNVIEGAALTLQGHWRILGTPGSGVLPVGVPPALQRTGNGLGRADPTPTGTTRGNALT